MKKKPIRKHENTKAAASALGVSVEAIKRARELGCPAFEPGNRIRHDDLKKWMAAHADELKVSGDNLSLKEQKINEEIRKLKIANDLKEKQLVRRADVLAAQAGMAAKIKQVLEQKLENEYPSAVAGMDVAQARIYGRRVHDAILVEHQKLCDLWKI